MAYNYRCTKRRACGARRTLRRPIEKYIRRPMCPACGKDTLAPVDKKEKARGKRRRCFCDGIPYPHATGTEPWCLHAKVGPTEKDFEERYR